MNKLLKILLVISSISILLILLIGGMPSTSSTSSELTFYVAFLLLILGYYLANYSNFRRIGIGITILSSLPLLIFIVALVGGLLLGMIFPSPVDLMD